MSVLKFFSVLNPTQTTYFIYYQCRAKKKSIDTINDIQAMYTISEACVFPFATSRISNNSQAWWQRNICIQKFTLTVKRVMKNDHLAWSCREYRVEYLYCCNCITQTCECICYYELKCFIKKERYNNVAFLLYHIELQILKIKNTVYENI